MNTKSHRDLQLGTGLIIATLCVAFFTMAALSNFKLGLHFDRDMRVIAEVLDHDAMNAFVKAKSTQGYETDLVISDNNIAILNISGVENADGFTKELLLAVPDSQILLLGSFGSLTKFANNQSFIAISLLGICAVILIYQTIMHRMYGWYKALEIIVIGMVPLLLVSSLGYALSVSVWYSILSIFFIQLIISENFQDTLMPRLFTGVGLSVLGFVLWISKIERFVAVSYVWLGAGVLSLLVLLLYRWVFLPLLTPYRYMHGMTPKKLIPSSVDGSYTKIKLITAGILTIALSLLLSMARGQYEIRSNERGHYKELVISKTDTVNYLEIQALLSRAGMFDEQVSYRISEQGQTWIEFSSKISVDDLKEAQVSLMKEFQLHSVYFDGVPPQNYFNTQVFNSLLFVMVMSMGLFILLGDGMKYLITYGVELGIGLISYTLLIHLLRLNHNQVWLLGLLILPVMQYLMTLDFKGRHHLPYFVESLILNAVILMMFTLPIFVIVPSAVSAELIFYFMVILISIYIGIGVGLLSDSMDREEDKDAITIKK